MHYTEEQVDSILHELNIRLLAGLINSSDVARIFTYRAEKEYGRKHLYTSSDVRRHVKSKTLPVAHRVHERMNLFKVEDAFTADLQPQKWRRDDQISVNSKDDLQST